MNISILFKILLFSAISICITPVFSMSLVAPLTDTVNTGIIDSKIAMNRSLASQNIEVSINNGVVTLVGEVKTKADEDALIRIVNSVSGIKSVDVSNLKVKNRF